MFCIRDIQDYLNLQKNVRDHLVVGVESNEILGDLTHVDENMIRGCCSK